MDSFDKIEAMLAELVEQVNSQKEQSGKVLKKLDGIDERLTRLESVEPPTGEQVSMITLKDHEEKMNEAVVVQTKWFTRYKEVKELSDALLAERPYWATKVWPIKAFRWIHDKRHYWIWIIYLLFTLILSLSICNSVFQRRKIAELRDTQMKYRFIKASGFAPNAVQFLEDAYEEGQKDRINYVETTVSNYEKALKHKADSIARAERKKLERF